MNRVVSSYVIQIQTNQAIDTPVQIVKTFDIQNESRSKQIFIIQCFNSIKYCYYFNDTQIMIVLIQRINYSFTRDLKSTINFNYKTERQQESKLGAKGSSCCRHLYPFKMHFTPPIEYNINTNVILIMYSACLAWHAKICYIKRELGKASTCVYLMNKE